MTEQNKKNLTSSLLQEEIINYSKKTDTSSVGKIISVGDGICTVYGLDKCMLGELVEFEDKTKGMVMNLNEDSVGIVRQKRIHPKIVAIRAQSPNFRVQDGANRLYVWQ